MKDRANPYAGLPGNEGKRPEFTLERRRPVDALTYVRVMIVQAEPKTATDGRFGYNVSFSDLALTQWVPAEVFHLYYRSLDRRETELLNRSPEEQLIGAIGASWENRKEDCEEGCSHRYNYVQKEDWWKCARCGDVRATDPPKDEIGDHPGRRPEWRL